MKKALALLMSVCMMLAVFSGCAGGAGSGADSEAVGQDEVKFEATETSKINKEELPHYKIAFSYAQFTDKLGSQFKASLQYLADAYNVEMVFFEAGMGSGDTLTALESVLAAGDIDGVITVNASPAQVAVAKKYNVPYVAACGFPSLEEEIKGVASYDNFLGGVVDDDVWAGKRCIEALYDAGCRKMCYSGLTLGMAKSHDDRAKSMKEVLKAHPDMELLADSYTMAEWANDVATFNAAYPEMDSIGFSAMTDAVYLALEAEGLTDGSVKISAVDISSQTGTYFKNGVQVWTCGGQYATAMVAWAVLYNYLADGTRIIPDPAVPLVRQYIEIQSYEDYEKYVKYVESPLPTYDADEIGKMIHKFNPDVTYADFEKDAKSYSLEDIIARHGDQIQ